MNRNEVTKQTADDLAISKQNLYKATEVFDNIQGRYSHLPKPMRTLARFITRGREVGFANLRDQVQDGYSSVAQLKQELDILTDAANLELDQYQAGTYNNVYHIWGELLNEPFNLVQYVVTEPTTAIKRKMVVNRISGIKGIQPIDDFYAHRLMEALLPVLQKRNRLEGKPNYFVFSQRNWAIFEKLVTQQGKFNITR